jgi:hypothetical protein
MSRFADLHLHTRHSDGTFTVPEVVERARAVGLSCISLTDHDTVAGLAEAAALCARAGIEFIAGVELTAHLDEREIHVLGYCLRWDDPEFNAQIDRFKAVRSRRIVDMVAKLQGNGVNLQLDDVTALGEQGGAMGRLHVARALVKRGFIREVDEAFRRFIGKGKPAFVPKFRLSVAEAAALLHRAGGVAILAHPGISNVEAQFAALLAAGLDGIEAWHCRHSPEQSRRYLDFTQAHGCLATGGSDCHGMAKDQLLIGAVRLDYGYVERLKEFHARTLSKVS